MSAGIIRQATNSSSQGSWRASWKRFSWARSRSPDVGQTGLVHADANPKNILVTRLGGGWRVDAVLDWEFSFSGCPYADAANMTRFSGDYPADFTDGFRSGFAGHQLADLPGTGDWAYLGDVLDMFALSDLVTRPPGHPVADQAARQIRRWTADSVPGAPG